MKKDCYSHLQTRRGIVRNETEIFLLVQQICEVRCHIEGVVETRCSSNSCQIRSSDQSEKCKDFRHIEYACAPHILTLITIFAIINPTECHLQRVATTTAAHSHLGQVVDLIFAVLVFVFVEQTIDTPQN